MKTPLFVVILIVGIQQVVFSQISHLTGKIWTYNSLAVINQSDTLLLFKKRATTNLWNMSAAKIIFSSNGAYQGVNVTGDSIQGSWQIGPKQELIVDVDTIRSYQITSTGFSYQMPLYFSTAELSLQGIAIHHMEPDMPICASLFSGNWNDSTIWSCGRIPTKLDDVFINENHIVILAENEIRDCKTLHLLKGAILKSNKNSSLKIALP